MVRLQTITCLQLTDDVRMTAVHYIMLINPFKYWTCILHSPVYL